MKRQFKQTISDELFELWKRLRRKKDTVTLANENGWSRPVVDRALNFGHIAKEEVLLRITDFYEKRYAEVTAGNEKVKSMLETLNELE